MYDLDTRNRVQQVVSGYGKKPKIATLLTHSALELLSGAKRLGYETVGIGAAGRTSFYMDYYPEIIDTLIEIDNFKNLVTESLIREGQDEEWLFVAHRGLSAYVPREQYEKKFLIPFVGSRQLLYIEDRAEDYNQTDLLRDAGINTPPVFTNPDDINCLVQVKVPSAKNPLERANFWAYSPETFWKEAQARIDGGMILKSDLEKAEIQQHIVGDYSNADFFFNPVEKYQPWIKGKSDSLIRTERIGRNWLMGFGERGQANLDGICRLPAQVQLKAKIKSRNVETGHRFKTVRESLIPRTVDAAERFLAVCNDKFPPGMIGVYGLQGVFDENMKFWVYDLAPRNPGDQALIISPYPGWTNVSDAKPGAGNMTARMVKMAIEQNQLARIVT